MAELLQNLSSSLGMYFDNVMGLNLALSLSIFIGGNFIVKNKGLKKAGYIVNIMVAAGGIYLHV